MTADDVFIYVTRTIDKEYQLYHIVHLSNECWRVKYIEEKHHPIPIDSPKAFDLIHDENTSMCTTCVPELKAKALRAIAKEK